MTRNNNKSPLRSVIATIILAASMLVGSGEAMAQGRPKTVGQEKSIMCQYKHPPDYTVGVMDSDGLPTLPNEEWCMENPFRSGSWIIKRKFDPPGELWAVYCTCTFGELIKQTAGQCPNEKECPETQSISKKMNQLPNIGGQVPWFYSANSKEECQTKVRQWVDGLKCNKNTQVEGGAQMGSLCKASQKVRCSEDEIPRVNDQSCVDDPKNPGLKICCDNPTDPQTCVDQVS